MTVENATHNRNADPLLVEETQLGPEVAPVASAMVAVLLREALANGEQIEFVTSDRPTVEPSTPVQK